MIATAYSTCGNTSVLTACTGNTVVSTVSFQAIWSTVNANQGTYATLVTNDITKATGCANCVTGVVFTQTASGHKTQTLAATASAVWAQVTMRGYDNVDSAALKANVDAQYASGSATLLASTTAVAAVNIKVLTVYTTVSPSSQSLSGAIANGLHGVQFLVLLFAVLAMVA